MNADVIDTNVIAVANREFSATLDCLQGCEQALMLIQAQKRLIVLDASFFIISEYKKHANQSGQPGVGDAFLKWLLRNRTNPACCEQVAITPRDMTGTQFAEFPADQDLDGFDLSDRKFVAVALASRNQPEIMNAVDSDWWHFRLPLQRNGVTIRFLCPDAMPQVKTSKSGG